MKYIVDRDKYEELIGVFLNNLFRDLEIVHLKDHPGFVNWLQSGSLIFEYNPRQNLLVVSSKPWSAIETMFSLSKEEVSDILKKWAMKNLDIYDDTKVKKMASDNFEMFFFPGRD